MLRVGFLQHEITESVRARRPWRLVRAFASFVSPRRWPTSRATQLAVEDAALARGNRTAARVVAGELADEPAAHRPRTPASIRRALALEVLARAMPPGPRAVEQTVAAYLRGQLAPPTSPTAASAAGATPGLGAAEQAASAATDAAARLREVGHAQPVIVATFPGFAPNPYGALMELAYESRGLAAVHVGRRDELEAIVAAEDAGGYRTVIHLNAPDRFVDRPPTDAEALAHAAAALAAIDRWIERGAMVVASVHNGPRLSGHWAVGERVVAQGIVDRAQLVHVLSASTPDRLASWISIDPGRCVHIPHPSYDGALGPLPPRAEARARLGLEAAGALDEPVLAGLVGSLVDRKGGLELLEAFTLAPDRLPDGRPLRLLMAGSPSGAHGEDLIRRAVGDPRVVDRLGYIPDADLPMLLAALDVAVVPYANLLNSGWLHLALTAGIPAIAPAGSTAEEIVDPEALLTYPDDGPALLARALGEAGRLVTPEARRAARRSVESLEPRVLSARFADAVLGALPARSAA